MELFTLIKCVIRLVFLKCKNSVNAADYKLIFIISAKRQQSNLHPLYFQLQANTAFLSSCTYLLWTSLTKEITHVASHVSVFVSSIMFSRYIHTGECVSTTCSSWLDYTCVSSHLLLAVHFLCLGLLWIMSLRTCVHTFFRGHTFHFSWVHP